ncbi:alcohol dehydrogenase catalytic domain-containing protein [Nakamurella sp. YIM 132087]|uniref:Alcohol dehydrogenase catalytic domain-containing protein n=1 Tax=Nakamurella alba TaxID=2665158 RepID=A0A7K1FEI4_9ACTN|nr:NAD(P)-dependent alcohol dehydrogenase [Nakamurella alba]MTD12480.1 alcohol dehydrogenase catalytic domain-containing protein [Nakamurella alba]
MRTTAAVARAAREPFTVEEVDLGGPGPDEVLVEIAGVGLCHTDIAARDGIYGLPYPLVLGHEGSGTVAAVGPAVTDLAIGDPVVLSFASCGGCVTCSAGRPAYCERFTEFNYIGSRPDGSATMTQPGGAMHGHFFGQSSFATHALAPRRSVVRVTTELATGLLGPLGCGIQTGAGAVMNSMDVRAGTRLVVLGGGPVGLAAVMAGAIRGCSAIVVVEPHADRRAFALTVGATAVVDPAEGPLADGLRAVVPQGADYLFDTTGRVEVISAALGVAAANATLGLVGVPQDFSVELPLNIVRAMQLGLTVKGIVEGDSDPQVFIPELLQYHREGRFPFDTMIRTYPLSDINAAVEAQHRGEVVKVVLLPGR